MASWIPSWLQLPSIDFSLPSSIQRRFISFVLRRSLGHFLKPGQLDVQQIDSQIGSGYVQVRDLELDHDVINALLVGLPIKLYDGSISSVTARIPWPNPLTANIGLSIQALHLVFHLDEEVKEVVVQDSANITESVVSVAESFMHHELSPGEEASLRESFHPDLASSSVSFHDVVPGGLDPFVSTDEETHPDMDPAGVSIFATMIERLLSRFEFDATDTIITLVHPSHSGYTFKFSDIRYGRDPELAVSSKTVDVSASAQASETRTVSLSGIALSCFDLRPQNIAPEDIVIANTLPGTIPHHDLPNTEGEKEAPQVDSLISPFPSSPSPSPSPPSPQPQSDSDMDEDTQLIMSQSITLLPAQSLSAWRDVRPPSPASTTASSMFESAVTTIQEGSEDALDGSSEVKQDVETSSSANSPLQDPLPPDRQSPSKPSFVLPEDQHRIVSISSTPILMRIITSLTSSGETSAPASSPCTSAASTSHPRPSTQPPRHRDLGQVKVEVTMGVIACALQDWQIRDIMETLDVVQKSISQSHPSEPSPGSEGKKALEGSLSPLSMLDQVEGRLHCAGVVVLLLPPQDSSGEAADKMRVPESAFFAHPLLPHDFPCGYARVLIERIDAAASVHSTTSSIKGASKPRDAGRPQRTSSSLLSTTKVIANLTIADLSVCIFKSATAQDEGSVVPFLITDPHLPSQYSFEEPYPSGPASPHRLDATFSVPPSDMPLLPTFDASDWTDSANRTTQAKLSTWRTRTPRKSRHVSSSGVRPYFGKSPPPDVPLHKDDSSKHDAALSVRLQLFSSTMNGRNPDDLAKENTVDVDISPLHLFADLALLDQDARGTSQFLQFVNTILDRPGKSGRREGSVEPRNLHQLDEESSVESSDGDTPPATPKGSRAQRLRQQQKERERERRRLEKLVLEDLDLSIDYRQTSSTPLPRSSRAHARHKKKRSSKKDDAVKVTLRIPMVRVQVRCPPPVGKSARSGALILDVHSLTLLSHPSSESPQPTTHFADVGDTPHDNFVRYSPEQDYLLAVEWQRVILACSLTGQDRVSSFVCLGSPFVSSAIHTPASVSLAWINPSRISSLTYTSAPSLVTTVDIPFVQVSLTKSTFDGLQFWADDVSQLVERSLTPVDGEKEGSFSQSPSLIGSKYFAKGSRTGSKDSSMSGTVGGTEQTAAAETIVKVIMAEVSLRLLLPREEDGKSLPTKPFDVLASNVDILLELKPEGKDETVLTLSVSDVNVIDACSTLPQPLFSLITSQTTLANSRPIVKLRFTSFVVPESASKESRINLTLSGFLYNFNPDLRWVSDLAQFVKPPPGVFESVVPSERTKVAIKVLESSVRLFSLKHKGALILHLGDMLFSTDIVGNSSNMVFDLSVHSLAALLNDDHTTIEEAVAPAMNPSSQGFMLFWKRMGYALIAEVSGLNLQVTQISDTLPNLEVIVDGLTLNIHLCADTGAAMGAFLSDFGAVFSKQDDESENHPTANQPTRITNEQDSSEELLASMDDQAFRRVPEVGAAPDLISDDLPSNPEYLDTSFGAAAGLRVLEDEDLDDFDESDVVSDNATLVAGEAGITSKIGGETIKLLRPEGIHAVENYFDSLPAILEETLQLGERRESIRIVDSQVTLFLYEGYDWLSTRKTIENEIKEMKRRLARIRQLVASGQSYDPNVDETSTLLFNSVYVGLEQDLTELEPNAALAVIDEELREDFDTASQSSWQSLRHQSQPSGRTPFQPAHGTRGQKLTRSKGPSIEFRLMGLNADVDRYVSGEELVSRTFATVKDVEILDHVKTSTWRKFLSALWADSRGNVRETDSNMIRVELRSVCPVPGNPAEEARLRVKILPLRLHVDQDALDFLKKFFSFQDPNAASSSPSSSNEIYFQQAEVFPVGLKLDYKPRRVDYRALRDGKTIELMNFFHFDGAEMTLRHITVCGVTGWGRFFDLLNDLWTPDVKATQLAEIISGVAPIRSIVNVGSGVADLVLLPIAQYRKDGRVIRGVQKGTKAFVKSTAMEAVKLGARLATGTQVILEQAENVLGSQFNESITAEMVPVSPEDEGDMESSQEWGVDKETGDLISKYAEQPTDVKEGMQTAYTSLRRNLNSAAQTILAVPMEVYERSGNEGPVRAVIRAVPIAVLKPMIGASEAVSKALMGIHNSMDPDVRRENETKYKQR